MTFGELACLFGLHDWHEHDVYSPPFRLAGGNRSINIHDKVCIRHGCGAESRCASKRWAMAEKRERRKEEVERRMRPRGDA